LSQNFTTGDKSSTVASAGPCGDEEKR
jgi:hypothetical protein